MKRIIILSILTFSFLLANAQQPNPVVLISGKVLNERTMAPVEVDVRITYETLPDGKEAGIARTNPLTGDYKIILPFGKLYGYLALAEGYYSVTKSLDVTNLTEYTEVDEQNLFLAPLKVDQVIILNNIFFKKKSAELKEESHPELLRFVEFLKVNKKIEIELSGHTDNKGAEEDNIKTSKDRAQAIATYISDKGIKEGRLTIKGYGPKFPIGFNNDKEGRARNNRIEFKILSLVKTK
jgi:outer membrane protein OmpA-like peptidoglycan-associated protein